MRYFERVLPGQADVDSALLAEAIEKLSQPRYGAHALMVLRHGKVVAEHYRAPYEAGTPHTMFSVSKSFTAIAAGFAQQEGLIRLTDKVADYFTEYLPAQPCENMLHMEIRRAFVGMDYALYSEFESRDALTAYATHPLHEEAKSHFFHLLDKRVAADYEL